MKVPIENVEKALEYWESLFRASANRKMNDIEKVFVARIFQTVGYLGHYIKLLKETGEGD